MFGGGVRGRSGVPSCTKDDAHSSSSLLDDCRDTGQLVGPSIVLIIQFFRWLCFDDPKKKHRKNNLDLDKSGDSKKMEVLLAAVADATPLAEPVPAEVTSLADVNSLPLAEAVVETTPIVSSDRWCFERSSERSSSGSDSSAPRMVRMTRKERDLFVLGMIYPNNV